MKASNFLSQNHKKESKQRFGEFEYFGGSDVANKLHDRYSLKKSQIGENI